MYNLIRSSYPDADQTPDSGQGPAAEADVVEPEQLVTDGFELVLPSGSNNGSVFLNHK